METVCIYVSRFAAEVTQANWRDRFEYYGQQQDIMRALPNLFPRVISGRTIRRKLFRKTETVLSRLTYTNFIPSLYTVVHDG